MPARVSPGSKPWTRLNALHLSLAHRLARAPIRALYSSPLERPRETATPLAERLGLETEISEALNEIDFGDWTGKVADTHYKGSFMNTLEWEMPYFNMGSTFDYAEMAYLIFPRPFMVERGHHDLIQPDSWIGHEFGKIRFFYDQFNQGDKAEIEYFNGGHSMRGEGTFRFLHKHLNWP